MSAPVFTYYRRPLVRNRIEAVEARLVEVALQYGSGDLTDRMFVEFESPVRILWSLVEVLDRRIGVNVAEQVRLLARDQGYEFDQMLNYAPPVPALWRLTAAVEAAGGGTVLIPSIEHLTNLGCSESALLNHISGRPNTQVIWTDPLSEVSRTTSDPRESAPSEPLAGVLGEFRVSPFCAALRMARFYCEEHLSRAGLSTLVDAVDELMVAVVGPAEQRWSGCIGTLNEQMEVRLTRPAGTRLLVIDVTETRDIADEPLDSKLQRICASGISVRRRYGSGGGTLTRCEVPIPMVARR
ncbi:hypothetical protein ACFWUP_21945 [Nocardia sp. NPDC058658]|uniref:hypothetical protein n=1 Tax=Nocardia sp. NPDC058658 TaxID=3346580 RepID=UPI00365E2232